MRTYKIAGIVFIVGVVIMLSAIVASSLVDSPKDIGTRGTREYSIARSGLPQLTRSALVTLAVLLFFSAIAMTYFIVGFSQN